MSPKSSATSLEAEAAEILRAVDLQASSLNQNALEAAREGEEARQNARRAADMIRRYKPSPAPRQPNNLPSLPKTSPTSPPRRTAHAELLNVRLELERCQRALAEEKEEHASTKKALEETQATETRLRVDMEKLLHDRETLREDLGRKNDELQRELEFTKQQLATAEQDAELALEIAQNNNKAREEIEQWYQQCLERNQQLEAVLEQQQQHLLQNGNHHVGPSEHQIVPAVSTPTNENKDVSTETPEPTPHTNEPSQAKPASAMIAAGRLLWEKHRGSSTYDKMPSLKSFTERAEQRSRLLTQRAKTLGEETTPLATMSPNSPSGLNSRIYKLLQESGRRLALPGRWWAKTEEPQHPTSESTETLTKHYCQQVELLVERKKTEIAELESFCSLMEEK